MEPMFHFSLKQLLLLLVPLVLFTVMSLPISLLPQTALAQGPTANNNRPVLAFYYPWYTMSSWDPNKMPDLPTTPYNSSEDTTIDRQVTEAANAGITGFISSWSGPEESTDQNFVKLLAHSATLESTTGKHFTLSIYFESDAPKVQGAD